ncbi:hypothetical protein AAMO2058_000118400 [Amorphochlora amoebiformis]
MRVLHVGIAAVVLLMVVSLVGTISMFEDSSQLEILRPGVEMARGGLGTTSASPSPESHEGGLGSTSVLPFPKPHEEECPRGLFEGSRVMYDGSLEGYERFFVEKEKIGSEGIGVSLWFRCMPREIIWKKGSRAKYITFGGPLITLKHRADAGTIVVGLQLDPAPPDSPANTTAFASFHLTTFLDGKIHSAKNISAPLADLQWHQVRLFLDTRSGVISASVDQSIETSTTLKFKYGKAVFNSRREFDMFFGGSPDMSFCPWCDRHNCPMGPVFHGQLFRPQLYNTSTLPHLPSHSPCHPAMLRLNPHELVYTNGTRKFTLHTAECPAPSSSNTPSPLPHVLYIIGHLRTFPFTQHFGPFLCPQLNISRSFLTVMAVPEHHIYTPERFKTLPQLVAGSEKVIKDWWGGVGYRLFSKFPCNSLSAIVLSEEARAKALDLLRNPVREKWPWARDSYDSVKLKQLGLSHPRFLAGTTIRLTAYRYHYLREAHAEGLRRYKQEHGIEMPVDQIIIFSRPDIQYRYRIGELSNVVKRLKVNPNLVFGFWDGYDLFDDRVLLTSRQVVDKLLHIDHNCKWEATWFNESSMLRMHLANLTRENEWGGKGPVVLWDFLLDVELVSEVVYSMMNDYFGEYFQYRWCILQPGRQCGVQTVLSKGLPKKRATSSCNHICGTFSGNPGPFNMSDVDDRKLDFTEEMDGRRLAAKVGYYPRVARGNTKGYYFRRVRNRPAILRELENVRMKCVTGTRN